MGSKQKLEVDEDSSMKQKMWQVYSFRKRNAFRLTFKQIQREFLSERRHSAFRIYFSWKAWVGSSVRTVDVPLFPGCGTSLQAGAKKC